MTTPETEPRPRLNQCLAILDEAETKKVGWAPEYVYTLEDAADCFRRARGKGRFQHSLGKGAQ